MSNVLALGILLTLASLGGLVFGVYALLRGGRDKEDEDPEGGGLGPIPERGIHLVAGLRITLVSLLSLAAGGYLIWAGLS